MTTPRPPSTRYRSAMIVLITIMGAAVVGFVVLHTVGGLIPSGPSWATGDGQHLWLLSHGSLHVLDANGKREIRVPLRELGLSESVSDLRPVSRDEVIVHDADRMLRCTLSAKRCDALASGLEAATRAKDGRKFDYDPGRHRLALSDVSHHHLYLFEVADGKARLLAENREDLFFPNQPRWMDGDLWLADTNHHRLVRMAEPAPLWKIAATLDTRSSLSRPGRRFPFAFLRLASGEFWVLVANYRMAAADLLIIGADGTSLRRIALHDDQDPVSLVAVADKIVVPDVSRFSLTALDQQGRILGPFGDEAFRAELSSAGERARWLHRAPAGLAILLVLCVVAGLVLAVRMRGGELDAVWGNPWRPAEERRPRPSAALTSPQSAGTSMPDNALVLELLPAMRRRMTMTLVAPLALTTLLFATVILLSFADLKAVAGFSFLTPNTRHMLWAVGLAIVGTLAIALYAGHSVSRWKGFAVSWKDGAPRVRIGGQWHAAPIERVMVTPQNLYLGGQRVPLRIGREALFDEAALRRIVLDRLPDTAFVDYEYEAFHHLWRFGGFRWRALMAMVIVMVIALMLVRVVGS